MKKLFAIVLFWLCAPAFAANAYACACDTGAHANCVPGSNTSPYDTPTKALTTPANWKTAFQARLAGEHISTCQGGAFDLFNTANMINSNGTAANPVVIDSYNDTARWSGGAGIKPKFNSTTGNAFSFNKGSLSHTEGLTIKDIAISGGTGQTGMLLGQDLDYVIIDNITMTGFDLAIQCNSGGLAVFTPAGNLDGLSNHFTVRNSTFTNLAQGAILSACNNSILENNTFSRIGTAVSMHAVYMDSATVKYTAQTISSITGDGTFATITTATPHLLPAGSRFTITVSGTTSSGSGTFNATTVWGTVLSPTAIQYGTAGTPVTGTPNASVVGTYSTLLDTHSQGIVIRNNTFTDMNFTGTGLCNLSQLVIHGDWSNGIIEGNTFSESVTSNAAGATSCIGIELDSGQYGAPQSYEKLNNFIIRNNTIINTGVGILLDICASCLVENNYINIPGGTSAYDIGGTFGIKMRGKNTVATAYFTGTATSATATTLTDSGAAFTGIVNGFSVVKITGGTGAGQRRWLASATGTTLTLLSTYPGWTTIPDATSTYVVSHSSALPYPDQEPTNNTIRYNTVYLGAPNLGSWGITLNANAVDPLLGTNHNLYGNVVVLGSTATTQTECFNTANLNRATQFAIIDYNACYYLGASVPKWDNVSSLATIQGGSAGTNDSHSLMASTASVTTGQPFFVNPALGPHITTSSALKNVGHPTLGPKTGWYGSVRNQGVRDIGAYEFGAALSVVPNSPTP